MRVVASLSTVLHTPIPYWIDMPILELLRWNDVAAKLYPAGG